MLAVGLGPNQVCSYLEPTQGKVAIAAVNSPSSVTLSDDDGAVATVKEKRFLLDFYKPEARHIFPSHDIIVRGICEAYETRNAQAQAGYRIEYQAKLGPMGIICFSLQDAIWRGPQPGVLA